MSAIKFPRSTRVLKGQFDAVPYLCVLFPLAFFLLFKDLLVLPHGTVLVLPAGEGRPALDPGIPTLAIAVTHSGRIYMENQAVDTDVFLSRLDQAARRIGEPPVLVIYADATLPYHRVVAVADLARQAGVSQILWATAPER